MYLCDPSFYTFRKNKPLYGVKTNVSLFSTKVFCFIFIVWYDNFNILTCENNNVKFFKILIKHMHDENVKKSFITRESEMFEPAIFRKDKRAIMFMFIMYLEL